MRIQPNIPSLGWALVLVTVLATLGVGVALGIELAVLTLAGGVLVLVIFGLWNSLLNLTGDSHLTLEEAVSLAAPTTEEEQKRAVLRTLKDLEYERSVGKISEQDYLELSRSYRARAKELIRAADEGIASGREQAERLLERRLRAGKKQKKGKKRDKTSKRSDPAAATGTLEAKAAPSADEESPIVDDAKDTDEERTLCPECRAKNDADAKFCKKCGSELEADA